VIGLLLVAAASVSSPQDSRNQNWDDWQNCIGRESEELSRGPDAASVVAGSVVRVCEPFLSGFVYYVDDSKAQYIADTEKERDEMREVIRQHRIDEFNYQHKRGYDNALDYVLNARARHASDH
jgi:hypothetical protein